MARIRSIKPEFFTSEQIAECSTNARLLFVGMWCFCDDRGVHPASPKRLKMEVFPGDSFTEDDITLMVQELTTAGLLNEFESDGKAYWYVTGWHHQKIDRPSYKYPCPPAVQKFDEHSPNDRRTSGDVSPTAPPRNGMDGNGVLNTNPPYPPLEGGIAVEDSDPSSASQTLETKSPQPPKPKPKPRASRFLSKRELADTGTVLAWLSRRSKKLRLDSDHHETRIRALAAAEVAQRADRSGYFEAVMRNQRWGQLPDADVAIAKRRLSDHQTSNIPETVARVSDRLLLPDPFEGMDLRTEDFQHVA